MVGMVVMDMALEMVSIIQAIIICMETLMDMEIAMDIHIPIMAQHGQMVIMGLVDGMVLFGESKLELVFNDFAIGV